MKFFLLTILVFLSAEASAGSGHEGGDEQRERLVPILAPIKIELPQICAIPQPFTIPNFLMAETSCFQEDELVRACQCLKHQSLTYITAANDYIQTKRIGRKAMQEATFASARKRLDDGAGVETLQVLVSNPSVEDEDLKKLTESVEVAKTRNFIQRSTDYLTGHGKDKKIENISNDYIKYMDEFEDCISFTDFSLINNIPKKPFIAALNDPDLKIEDFTESTASTNDPKVKARREAIKDFLLFNLDWQSAFTSGDKKEAYANILKIYKSVKPDTFYKAATNPRDKALVLARLEEEKSHFFRKQKLAKFIQKNKKEKRNNYEDSVGVILKHADLISSTPELLDKSLHFQGLPSRKECKEGLAEVTDCQTIYVNYCNAKGNIAELTDKERLKIENAFEVIDDNAYVMDRYKDVTKKYCSDAKRIDNSSGKIVGPLPETVNFQNFKKMLCVDETISIKGMNDKSLCKNKQKLMGFFLQNVVDQKLIPEESVADTDGDPIEDGDFVDQFAQVYSNVEVHSDPSITTLAKSIALGEGGEDVRNSMISAMKENQKNNVSALGNQELLNEVRSEKKLEEALAANSQNPISAPVYEQAAVAKNVADQANMAIAKVSPEVVQNYGLSPFFPALTPTENLIEQKTVADAGVENIQKRLDKLVKDQEAEKADAQNAEITKLKNELSSLKEYSSSISKLIDEKNQKSTDVVADASIPNGPASISDKTISRQIASLPTINEQNPSKVYDNYFSDGNFHSSAPVGQSAMINRQIIDAKGSNEALNAVYSNQAIKAALQNPDSGTGNLVLMTSPIEITEGGESKFSRREVHVEQIVLDEIKANPDKLKMFFSDNKIDHIGLLTLRASSNSAANYIVRKNDQGKLLIVPVNIARKSRLDDLKRTLQVQAF